MSEEQINSLNSSCNFIANNLLYNAYQKFALSKLVGKKITGVLVGHENAFICMKDSRGKKYVLYIYVNEDTGLPDYVVFDQSSNLRCFQMRMCWEKREYKKWLKQVKYAVKIWRERITKKVNLE